MNSVQTTILIVAIAATATLPLAARKAAHDVSNMQISCFNSGC